MPHLFLTRSLSLALTAGIVAFSSDQRMWLSLLASIAFGHFFISLMYSKRQFASVAQRRQSWLPFILFAAAGTGLYWHNFPLGFYFMLHHAFNEGYSVQPLPQLRTSAAVMHFLLFAWMAREMIWVREIDSGLLLIAVHGATFYHLAHVVSARKVLGRARFFDVLGAELIGVAMIGATCFATFTAEQIACYHYVFWWFYPLSRMFASGGGRSLAQYAVITAGVTGLFVVLSPLKLVPFHFTAFEYTWFFTFQAFVHITLSFSLSRANPAWINRLFVPPAPAPTAPGSGYVDRSSGAALDALAKERAF
jgi:hypothetical protein